MKKLLNIIIACAIILISTTVFADEFTDSADMSYSYDENYDQTQEEDDKISNWYDSYGEDYDPAYDETTTETVYYEEKEYTSVSDDYKNADNTGDYISDDYYDSTDGIKVFVDDKEIRFDVPPMIVNERTMVPLRAIFEALGADVRWEASTNAVVANYGRTKVVLYIDNKVMYVNGEEVYLDTPPFITDERTLVPVRAISEAFDCTVRWDGRSRTVSVYTK